LHFLLSDFDLLLLLLLELDLFFFVRGEDDDDDDDNEFDSGVGDRGLFRTVDERVIIMSLLNSERKKVH
jgi:hypothetical protein